MRRMKIISEEVGVEWLNQEEKKIKTRMMLRGGCKSKRLEIMIMYGKSIEDTKRANSSQTVREIWKRCKDEMKNGSLVRRRQGRKWALAHYAGNQPTWHELLGNQANPHLHTFPGTPLKTKRCPTQISDIQNGNSTAACLHNRGMWVIPGCCLT